MGSLLEICFPQRTWVVRPRREVYGFTQRMFWANQNALGTTRFDSCRTGAEAGGDTGLRDKWANQAPIKLYIVNMGIYSAMTMKPITTPIMIVIIGSSMDNALALACSTSLSK